MKRGNWTTTQQLITKYKNQNMGEVSKTMTAEQIITVIADTTGIPIEEVVPTADLNHDLGLDSLDRIEIIMAFEKTFDISIPDDSVENVVTVQDLIDVVTKITA